MARGFKMFLMDRLNSEFFLVWDEQNQQRPALDKPKCASDNFARCVAGLKPNFAQPRRAESGQTHKSNNHYQYLKGLFLWLEFVLLFQRCQTMARRRWVLTCSC